MINNEKELLYYGIEIAHKKKYLSPTVCIRYPRIEDIITTSPLDMGDEYEGEMDWNMLE